MIPPNDRPAENSPDGRLPTWVGSPLEPRNRGAMLTAEDVICEIGNPKALEAVLVVCVFSVFSLEFWSNEKSTVGVCKKTVPTLLVYDRVTLQQSQNTPCDQRFGSGSENYTVCRCEIK